MHKKYSLFIDPFVKFFIIDKKWLGIGTIDIFYHFRCLIYLMNLRIFLQEEIYKSQYLFFLYTKHTILFLILYLNI